MKRLCSAAGCKEIVEDGSSRCPRHPLTPPTIPKRRYSHQYINGKRIYNTQRWVNLRNRYATHQPLCEHCLRVGLSVPGEEVDHVHELEDGGDPWDWDNLSHLCHSCHNRKSARERSKRRRKKGQNGFGSISDF
jgi:5-methylcytosine-specific restriction protein A